jgi:hypothetical protein
VSNHLSSLLCMSHHSTSHDITTHIATRHLTPPHMTTYHITAVAFLLHFTHSLTHSHNSVLSLACATHRNLNFKARTHLLSLLFYALYFLLHLSLHSFLFFLPSFLFTSLRFSLIPFSLLISLLLPSLSSHPFSLLSPSLIYR